MLNAKVILRCIDIGSGGRGGLIPPGFWNCEENVVFFAVSGKNKFHHIWITLGENPLAASPGNILPTPMLRHGFILMVFVQSAGGCNF